MIPIDIFLFLSRIENCADFVLYLWQVALSRKSPYVQTAHRVSGHILENLAGFTATDMSAGALCHDCINSGLMTSFVVVDSGLLGFL